MPSAVPQIVWRKPTGGVLAARQGLRAAFGAADATESWADDLDAQNPEFRALLEMGAPDVVGATTAKQLVLGLLKLAAEVEQALMVQYLYAAASVSASASGGINGAVALTRIAVQEMAHLATVQNLLLLVGGPDAFHVQRDQIRKSDPDNPLPFVLQPLGAGSLAEYVEAEMPAEIPPELMRRVDELLERARRAGGPGLHRVGTIYTKLKWLFLKPDEAKAWMPNWQMAELPDMHLADADFQGVAVISRFQADRDEFQAPNDSFLLETCKDAKEAVAAIDLIAAQGEGLADMGASHFQVFLKVAQAFDDGRFTITKLARSPTLTPGLGGEDGRTITDFYTKLWGEVFALQYGTMTLTLLQGLRSPRDDDASKQRRIAIISLAIAAMREIMKAELLPLFSDLPLAADGTDLAGPPFDLNPALIEPAADDVLTTRQLDALRKLSDLYVSIESHPAFANHPGHAGSLAALRDYDKGKRDALAPTS